MKQQLLSPAGIRILAAAVLSLAYGILSGNVLLRFIDGLSIASVLYLLAGVLVYWWKEGFFSFFTWQKKEGSFLEYRNQIQQERKHTDNPSLWAGLFLLVISLVLTLLYTLLR